MHFPLFINAYKYGAVGLKVIGILLPNHEENSLVRIMVYIHGVLIEERKNSMTQQNEMPMKSIQNIVCSFYKDPHV